MVSSLFEDDTDTCLQVAIYSNLILATTSSLQEAMMEVTEISNSAF